MKPLVSVITVCFNAAGTIQATLDSVRAQTWRPVESVVVDGASKDGTQDIVARYDDVTGSVVSEPDRGIYDAMNKGVERATGEYVFFLNADDRFADPGVLADVVAYLTAHPETDVLCGNALYDDGHQRERRRFNWVTPSNLLYGNLCHQAVFARRALFESVGSFDLAFPIVADYDWLLRVFRSGAVTRYIDRDVAVFFSGGMHSRSLEKLQREKRQVQSRYAGPLAFSIGHFFFRLRRKLGLLPGFRGEPV